MIFANALCGPFQGLPNTALYPVEFGTAALSCGGLSNTATTYANMVIVGLGSLGGFLQLGQNVDFMSSVSSINIEWSPTWLCVYSSDATGYSPFVATRIEEAKTARRYIDQIETLNDNWDGYGAAHASTQTCHNARLFIDMIEAGQSSLPMPEISPTPSGTISFEWEMPYTEAYLEIGNTRYSGFVRTNGQEPTLLQGRTDFLDQQLVADIQRAISAPVTPSPSVTEIHTRAPRYELMVP